MRPGLLLLTRACGRWRPPLIRCRLAHNTYARHSTISPASREETPGKYTPSASDDPVKAAFTPEHSALYQKDRLSLSRLETEIKLRNRGLGPLSATDLEIQEKLRQPDSKPAEILRHSIAGNIVSPHVIGLCLETQYERAIKWPRKDRPEFYDTVKSEGLARLVLSCST
jgi:hypothetical protein